MAIYVRTLCLYVLLPVLGLAHPLVDCRRSEVVGKKVSAFIAYYVAPSG